VALDDAVAAIRHVLANDLIAGSVNVVSPNPVTNREFTATLARVLSRPAILPVPAFALRLALGEMADQLLLSSARVEPAKLLASGFEFRFGGMEAALRHALEKQSKRER
jgi:NAD dependent epimerase/dehydratase family enzyme